MRRLDRPGRIGRFLFWLLLAELLLFLLLGTALRRRFEAPRHDYVGRSATGSGHDGVGCSAAAPGHDGVGRSATAPGPLHVRHARASVLHPGHHEEQVG